MWLSCERKCAPRLTMSEVRLLTTVLYQIAVLCFYKSVFEHARAHAICNVGYKSTIKIVDSNLDTAYEDRAGIRPPEV